MSLQHEELSYRLRGGLFEVQNEVGLGRSEEMYHKAFAAWLRENGLKFESKPKYEIRSQGRTAHVLFPDFLVEDKIILELKAKKTALVGGEKAQLVNYLKSGNHSLGLLVNMGLDRVYVERFVYAPSEDSLNCDWGAWEAVECVAAGRLQDCLRGVYSEHGTGYSGEVLEKLIFSALPAYRLTFTARPVAEATYKGSVLGTGPLDCLLIDEKIVFCHTALYDDNGFNCSRTKSFMQALNVPMGVAANFGKKSLEIKAFSS